MRNKPIAAGQFVLRASMLLGMAVSLVTAYQPGALAEQLSAAASLVPVAPVAGELPLASSADALTLESIRIFKQNRISDAIELQKKVVEKYRKSSNAHAVLAYFFWSDNKTKEALVEARTATKIAPHQFQPLLNQAIMQQQVGDMQASIDSFARARLLDKKDWRAWLGQVQSLSFANRKTEAICALNEVSVGGKLDFSGECELASAYLWLGAFRSAVDAAATARRQAETPAQKSCAQVLLFSAYLRDGRLDDANEIMHEVFSNGKPTDAQIYIRAASLVAPVLRPGAGEDILTSATANLTRKEDADIFFKLARIFAQKSRLVSYDCTRYSAWLAIEARAYRRAIDLAPEIACYHLGLASVLSQQKEHEQFVAELLKAHSAEPQDQLTGYLLSKFKPQIVSTLEPTASISSSVCRLSLIKARVAVRGLSCGCKRSIVANSFRQIRGLVLTTIASNSPYDATVLIDESMIKLPSALESMYKKRPFPELSYQLISTKSVDNPGDAIDLDLDSRQMPFLADNDYHELQTQLVTKY